MNPSDAQKIGNSGEIDLDDMDEAHILKYIDRAIAARETETIALKIPKSVMVSLAKVAEHHDMSLLGLIQFYIGKGLRQHLQDLEA